MSNPVPKKSLGQHWLHDDEYLDAIVASAGLQASDTVLEIGPGLGTLTKKLIAVVDHVVAVEFDKILAVGLPARLNNPENLTVIEADILSLNFTELPADYVVVANIPYYLTSNLIRTLSETKNPPKKVVILVQKEVAERVATGPGGMSLLSVSAQTFFTATLGVVVPAKVFTPPPKVDSQVLVLAKRAEPLVVEADQEAFFRLVKAGFSERRKKLRSSLSGGLAITKPEADELLTQAGLNPDLRAQALSLDEWLALARVWQAKQK